MSRSTLPRLTYPVAVVDKQRVMGEQSKANPRRPQMISVRQPVRISLAHPSGAKNALRYFISGHGANTHQIEHEVDRQRHVNQPRQSKHSSEHTSYENLLTNFLIQIQFEDGPQVHVGHQGPREGAIPGPSHHTNVNGPSRNGNCKCQSLL